MSRTIEVKENGLHVLFEVNRTERFFPGRNYRPEENRRRPGIPCAGSAGDRKDNQGNARV